MGGERSKRPLTKAFQNYIQKKSVGKVGNLIFSNSHHHFLAYYNFKPQIPGWMFNRIVRYMMHKAVCRIACSRIYPETQTLFKRAVSSAKGSLLRPFRYLPWRSILPLKSLLLCYCSYISIQVLVLRHKNLESFQKCTLNPCISQYQHALYLGIFYFCNCNKK